MTNLDERSVEVTTVDAVLPERKEYTRPAIIHELDLETRAGSPFSGPLLDPLDPLGLKKH